MKSNILFLMLSVILLIACVPIKELHETTKSEHTSLLDSISESVHRDVKPIVVFGSSVELLVPESEFALLPNGAGYFAKASKQDISGAPQSMASIAITKKPGGVISITAQCDSLQLMVESMTRELTIYKRRVSELTEASMGVVEKTTYEPTGWQWFQIWGFRLLLLSVLVNLSLKRFNISKLWQKIFS
ncbi:hypothetical protein [Alkaliflexus imshenetskii]|uniref:hypothetical protein n=1 Tax=Alkaliflexus imshenetskii TaxID=286730 RepID=UPI00047A29AE|nr:hypothetical protein [Alkaliflexus imshenetskii]